MKKVISMLVALATTLSISVMAFADAVPEDFNSGTNLTGTTDSGNPPALLAKSLAITEAVDSTNLSITAGTLFLFDESSKVIAGINNMLTPDNEYTFRVYVVKDGMTVNSSADVTDLNTVQITAADLKGGVLRLNTIKNSTYITSAKIKTASKSGVINYDVVIQTKAQYGTSINDVAYKLTIAGGKDVTIKDTNLYFQVGWNKIDESATNVGEDGVITISNDAPVVSKDQFTDISKNANYKNVIFEGSDGGWSFKGRTSGMPNSNFYYTYDAPSEVINKIPDMNSKFLSFKSPITFPNNGEMRIDASDVVGHTNRVYVYLYRDGYLTPIASTYDSDTDEVVFRTNYLGSFVLTDAEITNTSIIGNNTEPTITEQPTERPSGAENPSTGASNGLSLGVTIGLAALVGASALARKRK